MRRGTPRRATAPTRRTTTAVKCWSGRVAVDAEIAPLVRAWNSTDWIITQESCSGHGQRPAYVTVNVRLANLATFVGLVRAIESKLGGGTLDTYKESVSLHMTLQHAGFVVGTLWTAEWGTLDLAVYGTGHQHALTPDELKRFVVAATTFDDAAAFIDRERDLHPLLVRAMRRGE